MPYPDRRGARDRSLRARGVLDRDDTEEELENFPESREAQSAESRWQFSTYAILYVLWGIACCCVAHQGLVASAMLPIAVFCDGRLIEMENRCRRT